VTLSRGRGDAVAKAKFSMKLLELLIKNIIAKKNVDAILTGLLTAEIPGSKG
jgi:hypothetical protein